MMISLGNFIFRYRTITSPLLLLLLFLPGPELFENPYSAALAGLSFAALGQTIRAATIGLDYIVRGGRNRRVYADRLVSSGLFAHTRNPLYVGKFLMAIGLGVAANSWSALIAISAGYSFLYHAVVLAEEAYLRDRFGSAFDTYCQSTPRWWPKLAGLGRTFSDFRFNWRRVLAKEYSAPLGWILPISLVGLYNMRSLAHVGAQSVVLKSLLGVALVFWIVVGGLKKLGRLTPEPVS